MDRIEQVKLDPFSEILALSEEEKEQRGLVHTPREIAQQPETWESTRNICLQQADEIKAFLAASGVCAGPGSVTKVVLVGAGTSDFVGGCVENLIARQWQCDAEAIPSTDLLTNAEDFIREDRPYLWISFSRSGDSPEAVAVVASATERFRRVRHLVITCNAQARLVREFGGRPDVLPIVLSDKVNDRALAMTSSFSNMVVAGHCLAHIYAPQPYQDLLGRMSAAARRFISPSAERAAQLADQDYAKVCFLGSGPLKSLAKEASLKVLELSAGKLYTFCESYLGLRHGPLSAVNSRTLVVGFLSSDEKRRSYELDLLEELKVKGLPGRIVIIAAFADERVRPIADDVLALNVDGIPDGYRPVTDVIFAQLLGLFASLRFGGKPDTPSPNGAITRVVRPIKIY